MMTPSGVVLLCRIQLLFSRRIPLYCVPACRLSYFRSHIPFLYLTLNTGTLQHSLYTNLICVCP